MNKKVLKTGDDGYGNKNIKVTKTKKYITISISDPHDWGGETTICLDNDVMKEIAKFIK